MKLSLWDTAGQETYKSITRSYFRGASGALLVFDITRRSTFDSVTSWLTDLRQLAEDDIVIILVGNKADLAGASLAEHDNDNDNNEDGTGAKDKSGNETARKEPSSSSSSTTTTTTTTHNHRAVTRPEAEEWCARNNVLRYVETSAKSGLGVEMAFREVAERIWQGIEAGRYDLNDRRSGVKGRGVDGGGGGGTSGRGGTGRGRGGQGGGGGAVMLGMNDVTGGKRNGRGGASMGGCC